MGPAYPAFVPVNQYQVSSCVPSGTGVDSGRAERLLNLPQAKNLPPERFASWRRYVNYYCALWLFQEAGTAFGRLEYQVARDRIFDLQFRLGGKQSALIAALQARRQVTVETWKDLANFQHRARTGGQRRARRHRHGR